MNDLEKHIQREILRIWGAHPRIRLFRRNVGVGWFADGQPARKSDRGAYPVQFGIPGQADLGGLISPSGRMLEIECKSASGRQTPEQKAWQRSVERFGGIYILARSPDDVGRVLTPIVGPP